MGACLAGSGGVRCRRSRHPGGTPRATRRRRAPETLGGSAYGLHLCSQPPEITTPGRSVNRGRPWKQVPLFVKAGGSLSPAKIGGAKTGQILGNGCRQGGEPAAVGLWEWGE